VSLSYSDGRNLRDAVAKKHIPEKVVIEVTSDLLATILGQRFTGSDGRVISMEKVTFHYDPYLERTVADPVFVEVNHGIFANPAVD
jgi:hypothetical protein